MLKPIVALLATLALAACPGDTQTGADAGEADSGGGDSQGELPPVPTQAGVLYVGHYLSNELLIYRLDGDAPRQEHSVDLGAVTHDVAVDSVNDLLSVVSYEAKTARLYQLHRPAGSDQPLTPPTLLATLDHAELALYTLLDPYHHRLYAVTADDSGGTVTEFTLHVYDVSAPAAPVPVAGSPFAIPATMAVDIDPVRRVLFVVNIVDDTLHAFDLHDDGLVPLDGAPLDLKALYPEENEYLFQVRDVHVDLYHHRVVAARAQGNRSELVAFDYPADIPRGEARYGDFAGMADLTKLDDPFDMSEPLESRTVLLDAWEPLADPNLGAVFLSGLGYNGGGWSPVVMAMNADLSMAPACQEYEGSGCFYRIFTSAGAPVDYPLAGAGACLAWTQRVVAVASAQRDQPGRLHLYRYDDALGMTPWLPADSGNLNAANVPVALGCH